LICWLVYVVVIVWFIWSMISMVYVKHYKQYSIKYFLREQKHMKYFLREQNLEEVIQVKILVSYLSNNFVEQTKTTYNLWTYSILNYYIMIAVTNNNKPWYLITICAFLSKFFRFYLFHFSEFLSYFLGVACPALSKVPHVLVLRRGWLALRFVSDLLALLGQIYKIC
jgi:hypothetical protein